MSQYMLLVYLHLATVIPAFFIGTWLLFSHKGSRAHRNLGKGYLCLMLVTAMITLLMPAEVGPSFLGHFGFIHLFSVSVFYTVPAAFLAAKAGNVAKHRGNMIGLYVGGLLIAGGFAFMPGRVLHSWLFV